VVVKRLLVGRPLASDEQEHQRLPKKIALAVFSSDAISSTAYASEEILFVVALGGSSLALGLRTLVPIALAVALRTPFTGTRSIRWSCGLRVSPQKLSAPSCSASRWAW